jgi:negative regulator of flagellin synthesis FlgM
MQINGPSHAHGSQPINPTHASGASQAAGATPEVNSSDEVSISREADLLSRIGDLPDVRQERVDQIRAEIVNGTYETQEKLDLAISRLLDEVT